MTALFLAGSALSVGAIALDRYLAILHCLHYSAWLRWRYVSIVLGTVWGQALLSAVLPASNVVPVVYIPAQFTCDVKPAGSIIYLLARAIFVFVVPLMMLTFAYARVIYVARMHSRRIDVVGPKMARNSEEARRVDVSTNGAVAAGAMFSVRRLSVLSLPRQDEGGNHHSQKIRFRESDLELLGATPARIAAAADSNQAYRTYTCTTVRLVSLVLVFLVCYGFHVCNSLNVAFSDPSFSKADSGNGAAKSETLEKTGGILNANAGTVLDLGSNMDPMVTASFWLLVFNSMLNPFLYAVLSQRFRYFACRLLSRHDSRSAGTDQMGGNLFDVSLYSAFLRNLQGPSSHRSSMESCFDRVHSTRHSRCLRCSRSGDSSKASDSFCESRSSSFANFQNKASLQAAGQFLQVPSFISLNDEFGLPGGQETLELKRLDVTFGRQTTFSGGKVNNVGGAGCLTGDNKSQEQGQGQRLRDFKPGSPDDDFFFSQNNAARIRIVLDLV